MWSEYQRTGAVAGVRLPDGMAFAGQLPQPMFSPALKVDEGHDVNASKAEVARRFGRELADELERVSLALYAAARDHADAHGLILADTKFEFGHVDGRLTLIDEALTPDSSRYWDAARYAPGREQPSFDKQFVRDWLAGSGWDRQPPGPALPDAVVGGTRERYLEAYRLLTGHDLDLARYEGTTH